MTAVVGAGASRPAIRVLIADDQDSIRTAFRFFLDAQPDITVVGDAADGSTAYDLARSLRPDVCLFDIRMPGLDGLELTRRLAGPLVPDPMRVVVVTTFDLDEYVQTALAHGACGFLLKDASPTLLAEAVRAAAAGDSLVSPSVTVRLLRALADRPPTTRPPEPLQPLTGRENDVVRLLADGRTNAEIADDLHISLSTVKTHVAAVQLKLGARNRVEIATWAWRSGRAQDPPAPD